MDHISLIVQLMDIVTLSNGVYCAVMIETTVTIGVQVDRLEDPLHGLKMCLLVWRGFFAVSKHVCN